MGKIVFFNIPACGHTNPTVEVVRALTQRGHQVRYYSFGMFREALEGAGAAFTACDGYLPPMPKDFDRRVGKDFASLIGMATHVTLGMDERVCRELREFGPDCLVVDSMCVWGKLFAKKLRLPMVCSTTTFAFNRETAKMMKPGFREALYAIAGIPRISRNLRDLRKQGFAVKNLLDLIQNDEQTDTIVYTSRAFQPLAETFGERYAFVGPSLPQVPAEPRERGRPLVYISLGTVIRNQGFYQSCMEALGGGPYDVVLSAGEERRAALAKAAPANFRVEARVAQLAVLQNADVFITHCGMNSVSEAIYYEVPMILFPQQSEQNAVAQRAQELGAGLRPASASPGAIKAAVAEILGNRARYQAGLRGLSESFRAAGGAPRAADKIEAVIQGQG